MINLLHFWVEGVLVILDLAFHSVSKAVMCFHLLLVCIMSKLIQKLIIMSN